MPAINPVAEIAGAIKEGFKLLAQWRETAEIRKAKAAIEAAEKFIQVFSREGEFAGIKDEEQKKLLAHYRRRFFHFN